MPAAGLKPNIFLVFVFSCTPQAPIRTSWPRESSLQMASSHRCQGQRCACRDASTPGDFAESNPPAAGSKRYEFRVGPSVDNVWLEIAGRGTWFKETETGGSGCVYVDLRPGDRVRISEHVEAQERTRGTALDLRISEYNPQLQVWYDTARIECGGGGDACNREMLAEWLERVHKLPRGLWDACGSTKVEAPHWTSGETDLPHPPVITADLILHVYTFEPKAPPGNAECGKRHKDNE
jgi:hypothetical protein